jgi:hypothetical protein
MSELAPVPHPAADSSISAINKKLNAVFYLSDRTLVPSLLLTAKNFLFSYKYRIGATTNSYIIHLDNPLRYHQHKFLFLYDLLFVQEFTVDGNSSPCLI